MEASQIATNHDALLEALRMGVEYSFTVKCRALQVVMRPISISERVKLMNEVHQEVSMMPIESRTNVTEASLLTLRILELGSTDANGKAPRLPALFLNRMTNDEVMMLYKEYLDGCEKLDPAIETITEEKLFELIDHVKKNVQAPTEFSRRQLEMLVQLFCRMVERPAGK